MDRLFVVSGIDVHNVDPKPIVAWLRKVERMGTVMGAVCTGAHLLAKAGLLDGYRCTIHWENLPGFSEAFPEIDATGGLFEIDRDRFTSAGGTTALDMMLTLIASQHGPELASSVAEGILHGLAKLSVAPNEAGMKLGVETKHVMGDEDLPIASWTSADADHGDLELLG